MKRTFIVGTSLAAFLFAGVALAQDVTPRSFSYVGSWSSLLNYRSFEEPFWGEKITEATEGKWSADLTTFDQMGLNGSEIFRMLSTGAFSIGTTDVAYILSNAPALGGSNLPVLITSQEMANDVMAVYRPVIEEIIAETFSGAKLLGTSHFPQQALFCRDAIANMSDLNGKKIRATGRSVAQFLDAIGAAGVTISFAEVPGALQRGVIDCAFTGTLSGYQAGWFEVASHLYTLPVAGWDFILTAMNGDEWNSLTSVEQELLLNEVKQNYEIPAWEGAAAAYEEGVNCLTGIGECTHGTAANMVLVDVTEEDLQSARRISVEEVIPLWVDLVDSETVDRWNETVGQVTGLALDSK
ncbi:C4-dicarboxylate ABC transporter substrate-binding protein [Chelativorans sp. ZYF759]|uniref:TRAP transporter substrate-binding protein n=1 Tax=Chelativorans sp. ZYF759 TaxID=2692213 RepID=UPI00145FC56F|nr:TRAP transporter substrate-binding protein [Chelativorans sp. ZYF759]NMG41467.1 C4-dicarboxylate ABC transporter substrate-binding protein [Chelativorans sp. ZYF759]